MKDINIQIALSLFICVLFSSISIRLTDKFIVNLYQRDTIKSYFIFIMSFFLVLQVIWFLLTR